MVVAPILCLPCCVFILCRTCTTWLCWHSRAPAMEDALYEITSMRLLAGLSLEGAIPDHTTIMNFRHLLEKHKLGRKLFKEVHKWLSDSGIYFKEDTIVDATIGRLEKTCCSSPEQLNCPEQLFST